MKKITIFGLILLGVSFSFSLVSADVPSGPGWHSVDSCIKITNLNEFPDIIFIGVHVGLADGNGFLINNNECMEEGYKFSQLAIGWINKDNFSSIDLNNFKRSDPYTPIGINVLSTDVPFYAGEVKNNDHTKIITTEYIIKQNGELISLEKSKEITEYNNNKPLKTETFNGQDKKVETQVKKGFWKSIFCFFKISKNC